jgi:hypothetical protein
VRVQSRVTSRWPFTNSPPNSNHAPPSLNDPVKGFLPGADPDAALVERSYPGRPVAAKVQFLLEEIVQSLDL